MSMSIIKEKTFFGTALQFNRGILKMGFTQQLLILWRVRKVTSRAPDHPAIPLLVRPWLRPMKNLGENLTYQGLE